MIERLESNQEWVRNRKFFSTLIAIIMISGAFFIAIPLGTENARGASVQHNISSIRLLVNDNGQFNDLYWNGIRQTAYWGGNDYMGLVIDHDGYDHTSVDGEGIFISDFIDNDFDNVITPIYFEENTGARQISMAKFGHTKQDPWDTGFPQSDLNDIEVEQKVYTVAGANWVIIQWEVTNIAPSPLVDLYVGFYIVLSSFEGVENRGGLGGTSNDESNDWLNATLPCEGGLWVKDNPTGTTIALASASTSLPLDQCYVTSDDSYWPPNMVDDDLLYNASNSPDQLEPAGAPEDKYALVGWELGNIPVGNSTVLPMVIAFNTSETDVVNDVKDGQDFYTAETAPRLEITKTVNPSTIWLNGMGSPDTADVNLTIKGVGNPQIVHRPQDVVFLIDSSGSMAWNDPGYVRLNAVDIYMQDMNSNDRSAIVGFGHDYDIEPNVNCVCIPGFGWTCMPTFVSTGWLTDDMATPSSPVKAPNHLTSMDGPGYTLMQGDLWTLGPPDHPLTFFDPQCGTVGPGTNLEMAIQFGLEELIPGYVADPLSVAMAQPTFIAWDGNTYTGDPNIANRLFPSPGAKGRAGTLWIIILVTDGLPTHHQMYTDDEVAEAAANGVTIYTVGLSVTPLSPAEIYLNDSIAIPTGGKFYRANTAADLIGIYDAIGTEIRSIAASPPQTPAISMVSDVLPDYIELASPIFVDTGTVVTSPSPCQAGQVCFINWTINQDISIGEEHYMNYQIKANSPSPPDKNITKKPEAVVTYVNWEGIEISEDVPDVFITVLTPEVQPPLITDVQVSGNDINLVWNPSPSAVVDQYEIYGGPSQTALNLDLLDVLAVVPSVQTSWVDTLRLVTDPDEYYYVIRSVDTDPDPDSRSLTSNTGGYYRIQFVAGMNTFSLPLQPFGAISLDTLRNNMGASSISWLNASGYWRTSPPTTPPNAQMGEGYVVESPVSSHIFTGEPGAMILYTELYTWDFVEGSLVTATVNGNHIDLAWPSLGPGIEYYVYRSAFRNGFALGAYTTLGPFVGNTHTDLGVATSTSQFYYLVVPRNTTTSEDGASTYGVGVFTVEYNGNYMFGLPLRRMILGEMSADWYVDQILNCLGIVYLENGIWKAHFKEFKAGVYDTTITYGRGYELTVYDKAKYTHVGW